MESTYNEAVLENVPVVSPFTDLDGPPTGDELETALSKLKKGNAGGRSSILPELVSYAGAALWSRLLVLM